MQHHVPLALPPEKARYLLYIWLNGPGLRSGGFDPRTVQPVAVCCTHYTSTDSTYQNWSRANKTETGRLVMMSAVSLSILSLSLSMC